MSDLTYLRQLLDTPNQPVRPSAPRSAPRQPGPAPQVNSADLTYAAREAVRDVLPAAWQHLPDGTDTANILAGTLANHYAAQQQAQAVRLAATRTSDDGREDTEHELSPEAEGPGR